jgi:hypothetical protein
MVRQIVQKRMKICPLSFCLDRTPSSFSATHGDSV